MQNIEIREYQEYNEAEILSLYISVGWSNYYEKPDMLRQAYAHSLCILGAYANHLLVGIVRVVYQKVLLTENQPNTVKFYESIGFHAADKYNCIGFVNFTV